MADLTQDYQFDLDGFVFGLGREVFVEEDGFDPGAAGWRTQDSEVPHDDGLYFGSDYAEPPTWTWTMGVDKSNPKDALAVLGAAARTWRAERVRRTPGAVSTLRYRVGGRVRRVYGRPRNFAPAFDNRFTQGYNAVLADFRCADHLHYGDKRHTIDFSLGALSSAGGLKAPLREPLRTTQTLAVSRSGSVEIRTEAPTWAIVTIQGPVSQPVLTLQGGWSVGLDMVLTADDVVVIDPRPWARTAILNGDASVGGRLSRTSRLSAMRLEAGPAQFSLGGVATQTGARATVSWRDAHYGL